MMKFITQYWTQILFLVGVLSGFVQMKQASKEATKCSLRNDILQIYNEYKGKKEIPLYDFEAISLSYALYSKLKGNSFVSSIWEEVKTWKKL